MKLKYVYTLCNPVGRIIQDIALSRKEAREMKKLYEGMYNEKLKIVRFEQKGVIR